MVYKAFIAFSGYLSTRETINKGIIDDFTFRLHYTITTALLFLSSALISMSDLVGKNYQNCFMLIVYNFLFHWIYITKSEENVFNSF